MRLTKGGRQTMRSPYCGEDMNVSAARFALTDGPCDPYKPREFRRSKRETHLSTEQARAQAPTRLSHTHGDEGGPQGHRRAPLARPQAAFGLKALRPDFENDHAAPQAPRGFSRRPRRLARAGERLFHTGARPA